MSKPQDKLSQRVLVYELRHAIDRVRRAPWNTRAHLHLASVITENPRSARSRHVLYNIGPTRRAWLADYLTATFVAELVYARGLPSRSDARPR